MERNARAGTPYELTPDSRLSKAPRQNRDELPAENMMKLVQLFCAASAAAGEVPIPSTMTAAYIGEGSCTSGYMLKWVANPCSD